jgi:hypothetical protein
MRHLILPTASLCLAFALAPSLAHAQRLQIQASALGGTGISLGMGDAATVARRNATSVAVQASFSNSETPSLRYGVALRAEVEGKVTFGFVPQIYYLRALGSRVAIGAVGGIPIIVAPRTLYGIEAGMHIEISIIRWLSVCAQVVASFYPFGSDLPDDSFLFMVQGYAGLEFHF